MHGRGPRVEAGALFAELKRRRVFRALVGYGIAAFAVLQIVEPVMHGLRWPDTVLSYVVVALAVGFPIVVTLAWIFDVNQGRVERTGGGPGGARLVLILAGIGALAAAPGLLWYFVWRTDRGAAARAREPSIAVLPFVNLSSDRENEYFSDGVTEEIINALANVDGVRVVARTSAFSFKGKNVNVRQVGEELNVATVLEGSVRREVNQLRLQAQLIGAADGYHIWSKTFDRELKNVFSLEDELARAIVQSLKPRLVPAAALVQQTTSNAEAHDLYLKGRFFWNQRSREGFAKATARFEQAVALDPTYALAHSGLADCYSLSVDYARARAAVVLPKAKAHARKALELDDSLAEAHTSLGMVSELDFDWSSAEHEYKRAIELRPGYATAHHWYFLLLAQIGHLTEPREEAERAGQLDPTSGIINAALVGLFLDNRDYDGAIEQALKGLELNPNFDLARVWLAISYRQAGKFSEALAALDPVRAVPIGGLRAQLLADAGDRVAAQQLLAEVERRFSTQPVPRGGLALAHLALGDKDGAFLWLERGVEERDQTVVTGLKVSPQWEPIRSDPRYHTLLKRMKLE